ncbi:MAG: hypothetical protein WCH75_20210 [Candidatus Binatia bacterium]
MMNSASENSRQLLAALSSESSSTAEEVVGQVPVFTHRRYEVSLSEESLQRLGLNNLIRRVDSWEGFMTSMETFEDFSTIGRVAAEHDVEFDDFPGAFDVRNLPA